MGLLADAAKTPVSGTFTSSPITVQTCEQRRHFYPCCALRHTTCYHPPVFFALCAMGKQDHMGTEPTGSSAELVHRDIMQGSEVI